MNLKMTQNEQFRCHSICAIKRDSVYTIRSGVVFERAREMKDRVGERKSRRKVDAVEKKLRESLGNACIAYKNASI